MHFKNAVDGKYKLFSKDFQTIVPHLATKAQGISVCIVYVLDNPLLKNSFLSMCLVIFSERLLTLDGNRTEIVGRVAVSIGK